VGFSAPLFLYIAILMPVLRTENPLKSCLFFRKGGNYGDRIPHSDVSRIIKSIIFIRMKNSEIKTKRPASPMEAGLFSDKEEL
jgi:hypothetical protein